MKNNRKLLPVLAMMGIKKNGQIYLPYIGAVICSAFIYFIFGSILYNDIMGTLPHSAYVLALMQIGYVLLGIILVPFLYYTNSFLIKRRKKELGLYSILGMEKKHIGMMMLYESLYVYLITVSLGILIGVVFSKLAFLLLVNLTGLAIEASFSFDLKALKDTVIFFGGIFLLNLIINLIQVGKANPSELLRGGKKGEKEPKHLFLYSLLGLGLLGYGYYISINAMLDEMIFSDFFLAVLLVIAGTYFLFTSGSIALLCFLKSRKSFYFKSSNFITVSGMLYRMKKNAAGLVNICIFATMVVITLLCTVSLYAGTDGILAYRHPYDIEIVSYGGQGIEWSIINEKANQCSVSAAESISYRVSTGKLVKSENRLDKAQDQKVYSLNIVNGLSLEEYNRIEGKNVILSEDEILVYTPGADFGFSELVLAGKKYRVAEELREMRVEPKAESNTFENTIYLISKEPLPLLEEGDKQYQKFNLEGEPENKEAFAALLEQYMEEAPDRNSHLFNGFENRRANVSMNGGLLFLGIFFGIIFMMCMVLIMYYKQITEGFEDKESFDIMQKVGMSDGEVKQTIRKQILLVFFLPLLGACMHTMAAVHMIDKLLGSLSLFNTRLIYVSAALILLVFAVCYGISYILTAGSYYKIVKKMVS